MTKLVPRTCTELNSDGTVASTRSLAEYREVAAYVLLGDPGAGKTSSFETEAQAVRGYFISVRNFLTFDVRPEWRDRTLFIDGLDEARAGGHDGRVPLDQLRHKLDQLGRPSFRLSCREADWLGNSDRTRLAEVAPSGEIVALRLNPLTTSQVLQILANREDIQDPTSFLEAARNHGLTDLLSNPQTLNLLVKATLRGQWPETRRETFELACRELVTEANADHRAAMRGAAQPREALLDAAGNVCAVMLLADEPDISLSSEPGCLSVSDFNGTQAVPAALTTRLFTGHGGMERVTAAHRTVAEYLAARHLARLIESGLPVGRVLALMAGADGVVVSSLRGLHAWLAVHCAMHRTRLIDNDPLGVVLYGDVRGFSTQDKHRVLDGLARTARDDAGFRRESWNARPFGALCTPDMESVFRDILTAPSREPAQQALADCVVDALHYGTSVSDALTEVLLRVVRDADRWPAVRHGALQACLRHLPPDHPELARLLEDLGNGHVADDSDELLGMCLEALYPRQLTTQRVLDFLHAPKQPNRIGRYLQFWSGDLLTTALTQEGPALLDMLAARGLPEDPVEGGYIVRTMAGKLLVKGLEQWGDQIAGDRLCAWLGLGLDRYDHPRLEGDIHRTVQEWLSARPDRYKDVVAFAIHALWNPRSPYGLRHSCAVRLYGGTPPRDFGRWLLSRAENDPDRERAAELFDQAVGCLYSESGSEGLSFDFLEEWVGARPEFGARWKRMLYYEIPDFHWEQAARESERVQERKARAQIFREHAAELREGTGVPKTLYALAKAYEGLLYDARGDTPIERLADFLDDDAQLVLAALSGLRQAPFRSDLPSVEDIVQLDLDGREHFIRPPCLVAAQILFAENSVAFLAWPEAVLKRLVAFRLTDGTGATPEWIKALARVQPDLVAEVLTLYATRLFAAPDKHIHGLYALRNDQNYASVARQAVPRLLTRFPAAASASRLADLEDLLKAGLKHVAPDDMTAVIRTRMTQESLDDAQRTYLLAAVTLLDPERYSTKLHDFVAQDAGRTRHLMAFLHERIGRQDIGANLPVGVVGLLIRLLAPEYLHVPWPSGTFWMSPEMEASEYIEKLIHRLASDPDAQATQQIAGLLNEPRLEGWRPILRAAQQAQRVAHREKAYRHPSPAEAQLTLAGREPANVADLAALTGETLRDLARDIRHGDADGYKQFWNLDSHAKPIEPRVEDACRKTLLDRLRDRLSVLDIDAQPEGHYADDKRADIRVSFGGSAGFNVPIEIKRDRHAELWRAMHEQLIPLYTRDPGAGGYGIYLVFWFGQGGLPAKPGGRARPETAPELEDQLRAMLSDSERRLIQVCVMDVAKPTGRPPRR